VREVKRSRKGRGKGLLLRRTGGKGEERDGEEREGKGDSGGFGREVRGKGKVS